MDPDTQHTTTTVISGDSDKAGDVLSNPEHIWWLSLVKFLSQDWFERLWVIQEFALAKQAHLFPAGGIVCPGTMLLGILQAARHLNDIHAQHRHNGGHITVPHTFSSDFVRFYDILSARDLVRSNLEGSNFEDSKRHFQRLLLNLSHFKATDPQDSVFALLASLPRVICKTFL
jgi:hypothetical protein